MKRMKTGGQHGMENLSDSVFEGGPNPLLNYAVIAELMSYLPVPDLRQCRLVHSAWRAAATPYLKKNSWLRCCKKFHGKSNDKSSTYLDDICFSKTGDPNRVPELTELGLFGIQNFSVHLPPFLGRSSAKEILLKFLVDYGKHFRNVVLEISIETLELLGTVFTCLPNLESVSINFTRDFSQVTTWHVWPLSTLPRGMCSIKRISILNEYGSPEVRGSVVVNNHYNFLKRLLQIAPNLETLKLQNSICVQMPSWNFDNNRRRDYEQSENLYLRLLKDEAKVLCPKLKDLNLPDYFSPWDMKLMLQLDINFRQLVLPNLMDPYRYPTEAIKDAGPFIMSLLERHQSSLEVLELRMSSSIKKSDDSSPFSLKFPSFPKLRKLLVEFNVCEKDDYKAVQFEPVDYANQFPALNELSVLYDSVKDGENPKRFDGLVDFYNQFFPNNRQVCPTLQRLSVEVPHPKIRRKKSWNMNADYLQFSWRLELMFPNVHNHEEVNACRAIQPTDLNQFVANETRRVSRSMTKNYKLAVWDHEQAGN